MKRKIDAMFVAEVECQFVANLRAKFDIYA